MFVRPCYRKKDGKRHAYWALVESYRTERGPRQRVVAYLGRLDEEGRLGVEQAATPDAHGDDRQQCLPFADDTSHDDTTDAKPRWVTVNAFAEKIAFRISGSPKYSSIQAPDKIAAVGFTLSIPLYFGALP